MFSRLPIVPDASSKRTQAQVAARHEGPHAELAGDRSRALEEHPSLIEGGRVPGCGNAPGDPQRFGLVPPFT